MREDIEKCKTLDELFKIWKKEEIHKDKVFVSDGIVNPDVWNSSEYKKILFILKEAYGNKNNDWSLTKWLVECEKHPKMWKRIVEWTYGINYTTASEIKEYYPSIYDENKELIKSIAVMNLKKSNGKSHTDMSELGEYAKADSDFIKQQIKLISPNVIVCGYTLSTLDKNVYDGKIKYDKNCDDWFYFTNEFTGKETLVIDYYHPAARKGNKRKKYNRLAECCQKALLSKIKK